jgi:hydrogenase nickel incorporation protein HypA/HybF
MHELSIALSIVDGVLEEAGRHGTGQVEVVYVRVGRLSGVDKDALLFSYRVACGDTPLVNSRLEIEDVEVVIYCSQCQGERTLRSFPLLICDDCGSAANRVVHGDELEISRLEIAA